MAGNTLRSLDPLMGFFKLTTLDARQCHLKSLPTALHRGLPNLRELNLSHNTIRDIAPLAKLHRLRKLVLVDNELESVSECVTVLRGLEKLEELDLRMNPITAKFYPAVDVTMADGMSTAWPRQVAAFVSTLNDAAFVKRMCYRTAMIHGLTGRLTSLDGLLVDNGERKRAALQYTKLRASMASVMHDSSTSSVAPTPQKAHPVSLKWEAADLSMASGSYSSEVRGTAAQVREAPTHATSMPSATASTDLFSKDTANLLQRVERLRLGSKSQAAHPPSQGHATATNDTSSAHRNPAPQTFWVGFDSAPSTTLPALPAPPKRFTEHRQSVQPRKVKFHRESSSALKQRPLTVLPKNHAKPIIKSRAKSAATVPSFMARPQDRLYRPSTVSRHVEPAVHRYVVYSSNGKPMVLTRPAEERPSYYLPPPRRG